VGPGCGQDQPSPNREMLIHVLERIKGLGNIPKVALELKVTAKEVESSLQLKTWTSL
jgi:hypothetical protein